MNCFKRVIFVFLLITFLMISTACSGANQGAADGEAVSSTLMVSAAASLTEAMQEIQVKYGEVNPSVQVICNFASSGSLQQQIEQGAEVDVFLSAASKQMDALEEKELIDESTRKDLLLNEVVLIIPSDSTLQISDFNEVDNDHIQRIALGEPESVPVGKYADEVFRSLDILDAIVNKVVYAKDVKSVLTYVETGNADVGVVYGTDAKVSDKVEVVAVASEDSHSPIVYPAAVVKDSSNPRIAKEFMDFLCGDEAKAIFEKYGFVFIAQ